MKKNGFTLVELLIVMTIIAILATIMMGTINPIFQVNKANDTLRKKDLNRIKTAFEEYYNDKGCYPDQTVIGDLSNAANCNKSVGSFSQLNPWVCDPVTRKPYPVFSEPSTCPHWYKLYANLQNKTDSAIPSGWYGQGAIGLHLGDGSLSPDQANYGVASPNVNWNDLTYYSGCDIGGHTCNTDKYGGCQSFDHGDTCFGTGCFVTNNNTNTGCDSLCAVLTCVGP